MEPIERTEMVDIDAERFISLEFSREWPKYTVSWWVRRRVGESDFPLAEGKVDRLPPGPAESLDDMWDELRQRAVDEAQAAAESAALGAPQQSRRRSLLDRLLGRG